MNRLHRTPSGWQGAALLAAWAVFSAGWATGSAAAGSTARTTDATAQYQRWIIEMKDAPRGPFSGIKWFCHDGRVLPPKDYACAGKGQGWQHGEWSDRTRQIRAQGFQVANLLAGIEAEKVVANPAFADLYAQWLVERFLIASDGGWILRKAQFYRGAIQEEDEREGARRLLTAMAARDDWIGWRYAALRTGARLLPHGADDASAAKVRNLAAALADRTAAFQPLRVKIHGSPDASDAKAVRAWAEQPANAARRSAARRWRWPPRSTAYTPACRWRNAWPPHRARWPRRRGGCLRRWTRRSASMPRGRTPSGDCSTRPSC